MRGHLLLVGALVAVGGGCRGAASVAAAPPAATAVAPAVARVATGTAVPLRALSYNVALLPLGMHDGSARLARLPAALTAFAGDVVGLQEVWTPEARSALARSALHVAGRQGGGGLLLLSRHPVREERFVRFPSDGRSSLVEQFAGKGLLDAVVTTPAGDLRVVVSHLEAEDARVRDAQLEVLLRRLREEHAGLPRIVLADLNIQPTEDGSNLSARYLRLVDSGLVDVRRTDAAVPLDVGEPTFRSWPRTRDGAGPGAWYDYVLFASGDATDIRVTGYHVALNTAADALSDHNLLVADLVLVPTK